MLGARAISTAYSINERARNEQGNAQVSHIRLKINHTALNPHAVPAWVTRRRWAREGSRGLFEESYSTRSFPNMVGCSEQAYAKTPAFLTVYFQKRPAAISRESNFLSAAVAVCGNGS